MVWRSKFPARAVCNSTTRRYEEIIFLLPPVHRVEREERGDGNGKGGQDDEEETDPVDTDFIVDVPGLDPKGRFDELKTG